MGALVHRPMRGRHRPRLRDRRVGASGARERVGWCRGNRLHPRADHGRRCILTAHPQVGRACMPCAGLRPTSARSASAAAARRLRLLRGTRGSASSPPPTWRTNSATPPRTRRRPCCTGGIATPPHHLASTQANLASATPRNKFDRLLTSLRSASPLLSPGRAALGSVARRSRLEV